MTIFWTRRLTAQDHEIPQFSSVSARFPCECALKREIPLTQIGCSAFTVLIDVLGTLYSVKKSPTLKGGGHQMPPLA